MTTGEGLSMASDKTAARKQFDRWADSYERHRRSRFNAKTQGEALTALAASTSPRKLSRIQAIETTAGSASLTST